MLNNLQGRINIIQGDIRQVNGLFPQGTFDTVTVNPPYMKVIKTLDPSNRNIARHEIYCGIDDVAVAACKLLKFGGKLFIVHRAQRLAEVICALRERTLEPKTLRFVQPFTDTQPKLFLMSAMKGAAPDMRVEPPLIMYDQPGLYSEEAKCIYNNLSVF